MFNACLSRNVSNTFKRDQVKCIFATAFCFCLIKRRLLKKRLVCRTYSENAVSDTREEWFKWFRSGDFDADYRLHVAKETKKAPLEWEVLPFASSVLTRTLPVLITVYSDLCNTDCLVSASRKMRMSENGSMNGLLLKRIVSSDTIFMKGGKM